MKVAELAEYDWKECLKYAEKPTIPPRPITHVRLGLSSTHQIQRVIAHAEGENDGASWLLVLKLKRREKPYMFVSAWCDYTGWG